MEIILGKCEVCDMTLMSEAFEKSVFDGYFNLLISSEEYRRPSYVYFGGDLVCSFLTNDIFYKYILNMGII